MEERRAFRILTERMRYPGPDAEKMLESLRAYLLKEEQEKTIQNFPESWLLHLLSMADQLSDQERRYWVRHDLSLVETPEELDAMLTQAFCDPDSLRVIRSLHEEDSGPHRAGEETPAGNPHDDSLGELHVPGGASGGRVGVDA